MALCFVFTACASTATPPVDHPCSYAEPLDGYLAASWVNSRELKRAPAFLSSSSADENTKDLNSPGLSTEESQKAVAKEQLRVTIFPGDRQEENLKDWENIAVLPVFGYLMVEFSTGKRVLRRIIDYRLSCLSEGEVLLEIDSSNQYQVKVGEKADELFLVPSNGGEQSGVIPLKVKSRLPNHGNFGVYQSPEPPKGVQSMN